MKGFQSLFELLRRCFGGYSAQLFGAEQSQLRKHHSLINELQLENQLRDNYGKI